jgi:hypothetical protein
MSLNLSIEKIKKHKWAWMPVCLVFGLGILFSFVSASQNYLSDYLNENSKDIVGRGISLDSLAEHLQDERITLFARNQENPAYILVFWSVSCAPCLKDLQKLKTPAKNALLVPVNTDRISDLERAHKIYSSIVNDLPFLHDRDRFLQEQLKVKYLPTHVYLDKDGLITRHEVGNRVF